jgi:sugar-specific transcriptional regulator TrmB
MSVHQDLEKLGLSEKEVQVYLALLKSGKTKPSILAKTTRLNRATLYSVAKSLLAKGIIAEDVTGAVTSFYPLPPASLGKILEEQKRELREKESLIKDVARELKLLAVEKTYPIPKVTLIEESRLEKFLFANTEKWQKAISTSDGVWWGYQDKSFAEQFENWIHHTWETKASKSPNYKPQFFSNETAIEAKLGRKYSKDKREIKYLSDTDFTANTWVCGDYLIMIVTHHHPFYLIEIHDKVIAHNTREIFRKLWSMTL